LLILIKNPAQFHQSLFFFHHICARIPITRHRTPLRRTTRNILLMLHNVTRMNAIHQIDTHDNSNAHA
jgi:hypothetical protein